MFNPHIRNIEFELTNRCNAACPLCSRTGINKGALSDSVSNSGWKDLDPAVHQHVLDSLDLSKIEALDYGGCYGDPLMHPQVMRILKQGEGLYQEVQTNASLQTEKFWRESARIKNLRMWFHLDGLEDTNLIYRRLTDWAKIEKNAKTFLDAGGKASWVFIVFKHNEHQVEEARELSKRWGFDEFIVKKTSRKMKKGEATDTPVWTKDGIQHFSYEPPLNPEYIAEVVEHGVEPMAIDCYSEKRGTYYITCENEVYPCCVIGKYAYQNNHTEQRIDKIFNHINFDTRVDPINNQWSHIIDQYNAREENFRMNWEARTFNHCVQRCGQNTTCQKIHTPIKDGAGSKRFEGWSGPNNLRNM